MSAAAVTEAVPVASPDAPLARSTRDSLLAAERNPIRRFRMSRTSNPVRSCRPGFTSPRIRGRRPHALKEQVK
ncbi:hypothetical protein LK08_14610 [Streptomyces sp. MUSC 125]|nr:hypothetical protein LK08_14610 [Streptomyces sp. MUSC 125]